MPAAEEQESELLAGSVLEGGTLVGMLDTGRVLAVLAGARP